MQHVSRILTITSTLILALIGRPSQLSQAVPPTNENWQLVFDQEFSGNTIDATAWDTCDGSNLGRGCNGGNGELQLYRPEEVLVGNNMVSLRAQQKAYTDTQGHVWDYTGGILSTRNHFAFQYGYFEARMRMPRGRGMWTSFYALPWDRRSYPPELDAIEVLGSDPTVAHYTVHYNPAPNTPGEVSITGTLASGFDTAFHTIAMDWSPSALIWYVDGVEVNRDTTHIPNEPFVLLASLAVGSNWAGNAMPDGTTVFPSALEIDYVKVWQRGPNGVVLRGADLQRPDETDDLRDFSRMVAHTANLAISSSAPSDFLADNSRLVRTNNAPASMTWRYDNLARIDARAHFKPGEPVLPFVFWASPDNATWTALTPEEFFFSSNWSWIDYRIRAAPPGTNYLRVDFPGRADQRGWRAALVCKL